MARERVMLAARWVLWLILLWLVVRGVASVVVPNETVATPAQPVAQSPAPDSPAAGIHALLFARQYLTWQRDKADEYNARLRLWLPSSSDPAAAVDLSSATRDQTVTGAWVYKTERSGASQKVIQILAEVDSLHLVLLAVPISQTAAGPMVSDLPFFLPPPVVSGGPAPTYSGDTVPDTDGEARALVLAFFKAYAEGADTRFFMIPGAATAGFPAGAVTLSGTPGVRLYKETESVYAVADVLWRDLRTQAQFRQRYMLELVRQDRWLVKQILLERGTGQ